MIKIINFIGKNKLISLFVLAVIFGLSVSFIFSYQNIDPTALFIDSMAFKATALNIIERGDFSDPDQTTPNNFRAPGYPLWLALIYLIFGSFKFAIPVGIIIVSFTVPLTYLIAKELFNEKVALISGLLAAFEPWAVFLTGAIMSEQFFMPVFLLSIYLFIRYLKYDSKNSFYLSALFFGIATLTRPYILYFWCVLIIIVFFKNQKFYEFLKITTLATLIFILIVAPWAIRNKIVLNTWQFSSVPALSLYVENFNSLQVYLGNFKSWEEGYARAFEITPNSSVTSKEGSEILMKEALEGIISKTTKDKGFSEKEAKKAIEEAKDEAVDAASAGVWSEAVSASESSSENGKEVIEEPSASLQLLDFEYEVVNEDLVKITSLTYHISEMKIPMNSELFLFVYGDNDDEALFGLVRDQVRIGYVDYGQVISQTSSVSGYYQGDLSSQKNVKLALIGYFADQSYTLSTDSRNVLFT